MTSGSPERPHLRPRPARASELVGVAEIAAIFEIRRETVQCWIEQEGFPEPATEPMLGTVWDVREVRAWRRRALAASSTGGASGSAGPSRSARPGSAR